MLHTKDTLHQNHGAATNYLRIPDRKPEWLMKLTQEIIDQIQEAMNHTKKDGSINWQDSDEIEVNLSRDICC